METQQDLTTKIIDFIRSMPSVPAEVSAHITPETNIVRDLRLDSVAVMEFIMELEIAFNTIIPLDTIADIETVGDLAKAIESQQAKVSS